MDGQPKLGGIKHDDNKPQLGLLSKVFLWGIAEIMTMGVKEYGAHNWREGMEWHRPYDALQRHLTAWWDGENLDPKSGKSHLWHAGAELMFLAEYEAKGIGKDDRYKSNPDVPCQVQYDHGEADVEIHKTFINNSDLPY